MVKIITLAILLICNLTITNEWAKYGLYEVCLQRPLNGRVIGAILIGVITFMFTQLLQRSGIIKLDLLTAENYFQLTKTSLLISLAWLIIKRYLIMPKGQFAYNQAITRTIYWSTTSYSPGEFLKEEARALKNYYLAAKTLDQFDYALCAQYGKIFTEIKHNIIDLSGIQTSNAPMVNCYCPSCRMPLSVPKYAPKEVRGTCAFCGSTINVKTFGNKLYLNSYAKFIIERELTPLIQKNIATTYEETALLYRMMNEFRASHQNLDMALVIVNSLLATDSENPELLRLKSLILFRHAEAYQAEGIEKEAAKKLYRESLEIESKFGTQEDIEFTRKLLFKLELS